MLKAVIFDFDGTIVDSEKKRFEDLKAVLKERDLELNNKEFHHMEGETTLQFLKEDFPTLSEQERKAISEARRERERKTLHHIPLIPGVKELWTWLKQNNITIAIATGSVRELVENILNHHQLQNVPDLIVPGEEMTVSKPDPQIYQLTLDKLNISPKEAIVIEDALTGITAAKAAGCKAYGVCTYVPPEAFTEADGCFQDHHGVLAFLKKSL